MRSRQQKLVLLGDAVAESGGILRDAFARVPSRPRPLSVWSSVRARFEPLHASQSISQPTRTRMRDAAQSCA